MLSLAGGTLIGTLIYLQRELIGPLHRAMAELPEASTLNINLIAEEGNGLHKELRAGIISLSIWVNKYTSEVIRGEDDIQDLIDVNRMIMQGLSASAEAAA